MKPAIAYIRVSTARQGKSGLGLEAQQEALARFAKAEGYNLLQTFDEVETGKGADALERRPQLSAALKAAKQNKAPIIVAKLDRLSRDVHFISGLMPIRRPLSWQSWALMLIRLCGTCMPPSPRNSAGSSLGAPRTPLPPRRRKASSWAASMRAGSRSGTRPCNAPSNYGPCSPSLQASQRAPLPQC
jgi:hypothetical protein